MARYIFPTPRAEDFPPVGSVGDWRTWLGVPLRQQGEFIGMLNARRIEVRPFTPAQIKLLETFADQAVIALENVRLFNELKESLEQQTATSEILGVIASSPTDIQPVLDVVAENAARCVMRVMRRFDSRRWVLWHVASLWVDAGCLGRAAVAEASSPAAEPSSTAKRCTSMIVAPSGDRVPGSQELSRPAARARSCRAIASRRARDRGNS